MKYVPHWVIDALMSRKFKCHNCQKVFIAKDLKALGVKESSSEPEKEFFFIELACDKCRKATFFEMQEMNIVELSEDITNEIEEVLETMDINTDDVNMFKNIKKKSEEAPIKKKKEISKITLKDIRETVKVLKPKDFKHEQFLEMLGMSPEEIIKYREIK